MSDPAQGFSAEPDPENPGWRRWRLDDATRFNEAVIGKVIGRAEGTDQCRVRMFPQHHHTNLANNIHGAVTLGFIDIALFCAIGMLRDLNAGASVTLSLETQFIGPGDPGKPLDAVVEVLHETRRLTFLRGLVEQDGGLVASFSATVRKPTARA